MRALVIGKGKSGMGAAKALQAQGYDVAFADGYDLVVSSPGIRVKSELQLGCEELRRRGWRLLAVTGSKGKSSVVKLCAEAVGGVACGNYGTPVTDLIALTPRWAVVEVSSFQLETTTLPPDTFEAAAILNLQEDHLDRHGSVEVYHQLKRKLLTFAKFGIVPGAAADDGVRLLAGSYFDNEVLRANGCVAISLLRAAGVTDAKIAEAFAAFRPLPHRFETVGDYEGVRYVDDSKATSIAALAAGVKMCRKNGVSVKNVRLIAGGLAKGDDPKSALPELTSRVKKVYIIGCCAEKFLAAWSEGVDCEVCGTLDRAVESAVRDAEEGEVVLLSPGAASFDQFKSFGERGEVFVRLVKKEKEV